MIYQVKIFSFGNSFVLSSNSNKVVLVSSNISNSNSNTWLRNDDNNRFYLQDMNTRMYLMHEDKIESQLTLNNNFDSTNDNFFFSWSEPDSYGNRALQSYKNKTLNVNCESAIIGGNIYMDIWNNRSRGFMYWQEVVISES